MAKAKQTLQHLLQNGGARRLLLLAAALGAGLLLLSGSFGLGKGQEEPNESFSVSDYRQTAQRELEELLSHLPGAGKTRVLVTMENSAEVVFLENGAAKTKEIQPTVRGVLVLCEGGGDPVTAGRVTEAVTKALGVSSAKVCVEPLSEERSVSS